MTHFQITRRLNAPLLGFALLLPLGACATQENDASPASCNPKSVGCHVVSAGGAGGAGGSSSSAGATATGGSTTGGTDPGASGSTSTGGTVDLTGGNGGTSSTSGGASGAAAGGASSGTGGTANGGTASGGASTGGGGVGGAAAGTGGTPSGGAGGAAAGAGGTLSGGAGGAVGGSGGSNSALCTTPVPQRTSWVGTASSFSNTCNDPTYALCNPPAYAFDANPSSRFSTGTSQKGTEWLQIDLTTGGTVDQVTLSVSNGDYGRHLQIRMSNTDKDTAAPVLAEMDGMTGLMTFKFPPTTARFILISQTGTVMAGQTAWWSVYDMTATCN